MWRHNIYITTNSVSVNANTVQRISCSLFSNNEDIHFHRAVGILGSIYSHTNSIYVYRFLVFSMSHTTLCIPFIYTMRIGMIYTYGRRYHFIVFLLWKILDPYPKIVVLLEGQRKRVIIEDRIRVVFSICWECVCIFLTVMNIK